MVVIDDKAENDFLKGHVTSLSRIYWIGLRENEEKDSFEWIDGSGLTYGSEWKIEPWHIRRPKSVLFLSHYCKRLGLLYYKYL